jgi:hypothetical protein
MIKGNTLVSLTITAALMCITSVVFAQNTLIPAGESRYEATAFPDRIILVPTATPENSQTVNWRTRIDITAAVAEISLAQDTPALHLTAAKIEGETVRLDAGNGPAHHHRVNFTGLQPDTLYAYRVMGANTWSEWFQFRTAKAGFAPFTAIYFGDAQNAVKSHFSRVVREAFSSNAQARVMIHAGDLVNSRDGNHDDEWGEWFEAGGWLNGMINNVVAAGNHEHIEHASGPRTLAPHWAPQFGTPNNGPQPLQDTVYYTDFQGVRMIVLDSMQAVQSEAMAQLQAQWLRQVLSNNPNHWTVVTYHHPMFSVSLGRDNPALRQHWQGLFEEFGVDMVLQGHDHTYGRGQNIPTGASGQLDSAGPMYVVSVAGPKMYLVSEQAEETMLRTAEDTQLFQTLGFTEDRLRYEARTVTGELYDAFDIVRTDSGATRIEDRLPSGSPDRRCANPAPMNPQRCWNGTEFMESP